MCCMCPAVESWLLFLPAQLSAEILFACCGQCLIPYYVGHFLTRCVLVCLQNITCHHCHWNQSPTKVAGIDKGLVKFLLVFWGREPQHWTWGKHDWEGWATKHRGSGLSVSKLDSQCWHCAGPYRCCGFMPRPRWDKWCLSAALFLKGSHCDPYLSGSFSEMNKTHSLPFAPGVFQTDTSMLYLCCLFVMLSP